MCLGLIYIYRFYLNIDHRDIKLYHHTSFHFYSKVLPILLYIVYRDFITILIIGVLKFTITLISTFSGAFVSEIPKCLPEAI